MLCFRRMFVKSLMTTTSTLSVPKIMGILPLNSSNINLNAEGFENSNCQILIGFGSVLRLSLCIFCIFADAKIAINSTNVIPNAQK
jgi:hypothetical protein